MDTNLKSILPRVDHELPKARKDSDRDGKKSIRHSMTFIVFCFINGGGLFWAIL